MPLRERIFQFASSWQSEAVLKEHARNAAGWEAFCAERNYDPTLADLDTDDAKAERVSELAVYLHDQGKRETAVTRPLDGVRHYLLEKGVHTGFLREPLLAAVRKGLKRGTEEQRAHSIECVARLILPVSDEALDKIREEYWDKSSWDDFDGALFKVVALAVAVGFAFALRVSNYTKAARKANNHCVRAEDLGFLVTNSSVGAPPLEVALCDWAKGSDPSRVEGFVLSIHTTKTGKAAPTQVRRVRLKGDNPECDRILAMLLEYAEHVAPGVRGMPLFGVVRPRVSGKGAPHVRYLARLDIANAIKWASAEVGLPAERFSTHSLPKAAATAYARRGEAQALIQEGRWAKGSSAPRNHYDFSGSVTSSGAHALRVLGGAPRSTRSTKLAKSSK